MNATFNEANVFLKVDVESKSELLRFLSKKMSGLSNVSEEYIYELLSNREEQLTTGIGEGIAIPHCFSDKFNKFYIVFGTTKNEIDFQSIDKKPVSLFICICAHTSDNLKYLKVIAKFAEILHNPSQREKIIKCESIDDIARILNPLIQI
ncbi:MAG TPA: PTS sugar transporter subunit IIA [Exilispira sp.]|jgi:mannitol/fructose-specific phosphotransferase system IIA component (Ntr-type)|nr:PTS sugar transporter subunit IIA [Spirochaetota bacterium]NLJ05644.1 PTS sugar transporter subunit IIA [Exilispira sp.]HNV44262.1 PTS sugar transporter subunit IIA [Exilispira sp.]HOV46636.1 PTS sugar transporter subunit IIA [Exilispira sp.]HPO61037.1 PTS sugar transporter subunit IIA [Exilispira sp.]